MLNIIVIVEDKEEEQQNALNAIKVVTGADQEIHGAELVPGCPMFGLKSEDGVNKAQVLFAADLKAAQWKIEYAQALAKTDANIGVITDLMFPAEKGGAEEPNGLGVVVGCIDAELPVVVCSDTDHHDVNWLKPIFPALGKAHPAGDIPVILDRKDWEQAALRLAKLW